LARPNGQFPDPVLQALIKVGKGIVLPKSVTACIGNLIETRLH
jgi:hypothetical protein